MNPDCYQVLREDTGTYSEDIILAVIFVCWDRDPFTQMNPIKSESTNQFLAFPVQTLKKSRFNA
jgi:hypothetical protein